MSQVLPFTGAPGRRDLGNPGGKVPLSETTYYLVENRQPNGFDKYLPRSGVLIMYCDDKIPECRYGRSPVKLVDANPSIPNLEGAAFDLGGRDSFTDEKNHLQIRLLEKKGKTYKIIVKALSKSEALGHSYDVIFLSRESKTDDCPICRLSTERRRNMK